MTDEHDSIEFHEDRYYQDRSNLKHNLSFAGCGFLGLYHVGVCCCIRKLAPHLYKNKRMSGTSAGAIAAVCLVCDVNIAECMQYMCELIKNARQYLLGPFDPRFRINEQLREGLQRILPSDAHVLCSGRLSISMTCYATRKNVIINQFRDKDELINALLCSAYIPIFSGFVPPSFRGRTVIDGGWSDNLLCIDKMTIRVSPFSGDADICPLDAPWDAGYLTPAPQHVEDIIGSISFLNNNIRFTLKNIRRLICMVWPMSSEELASLACQGYEDARRYLITRGFIACQLHRNPLSVPTAYHERRYFSLTTPKATAVHRMRRNTSRHQVDSAIKQSNRKRHSDGANSSYSADRTGFGLRNRTVAHSISLHDLTRDLGWNVRVCGACQEELRKAICSNMPAFLIAIIKGDVERSRRSTTPSLLFPLNLMSYGWELAGDVMRTSLSSLHWLVCHMIRLPIVLQLDLLIYLATSSIDRLNPHSFCVSTLQHLIHVLTDVRSRIAAWEASRSARRGGGQFFTDSMPHRPNTRSAYPVERMRQLSQPAVMAHGLPNKLRSAILSGTYRLSDRLFCLHRIELPTAAECGLELFSSPTISFTRKLSLPSINRRFPGPQSTSPSTYRSLSPQFRFSNARNEDNVESTSIISQFASSIPRESSSPETEYQGSDSMQMNKTNELHSYQSSDRVIFDIPEK